MTKSTLQNLFYKMLRIRMIEEAIASRYHEGKMRCPTHLSIGQEAVAVGVCANLSDADLAISTHRSHAHYLAKGGSLNKMIAEIYGKETGCSRGRGGSMHLIDLDCGFEGSTAIVGNSMPVGVGLALGFQYRSQNNIVAIFFGEGSTEEGSFYESMNFAALKNLSILFICENNLYSVYSPLSSRQPKNRKITTLANALGVDAIAANGNDLNEVVKVTEDAIRKIRANGGPLLIEFFTYRWREHCGPNYDNDLGYRSEEEFNLWKQKDPIALIYKELSKSEISASSHQIKTDAITQEINDAFDFADKSPFPSPDSAYLHTYK